MDTKSGYLSRIDAIFPDLNVDDGDLVDHGWDHDVIITNGLVFRFPKREEYEKRFRKEIDLMNYLSSRVNIPVPNYHYVAPDKSFAGYELLPGQEMKPDGFKQMIEKQQQHVATQLGAFLTTIHNTPMAVVTERGYTEEVGGHYWSKQHTERTLDELKSEVYPKLVEEERKWIDLQFDAYLSLSFKYEKVLIHADLTPDHLLFDREQEELTGVIDFGDAGIGDPALDLAGLWAYGEDFVNNVVTHYERDIDDDMINRSRYPMRFEGPATLLEIAQGKKVPLTWDEAHGLLVKAMRKYLAR